MKRIANPLTYPTAALFAMLTLANPSRAAWVDVAPAPTAGTIPPHVLFAQAPSTPVPAEATQAPGLGTKPKASADDRVEAHIKKLHTELNITPAQEDLWKKVAQVMRDNEAAMDALHKSRAEQRTTMTAVADVKSYAAIADAHADGLKKFVSVFESLYNSMSDEQKQNADKMFSPRSSR
jgi:hypothetical protein